VRRFRAGFLAAAAITVAGALTGRDRLQLAAKPLMMPLLAADIGCSGQAGRAGRAGQELARSDRAVLLGAIGAATAGDILLIDPDDDRRLIAGASSFAVMQAGYTTLWLRHGARPQPVLVVQRALAWFGAAVLLRKKAPNVAGPLTAYGALLATSGTLAGDPALAPNAPTVAGINVPGSDPRSRLGLGAALFTFSDGLIVLRRVFARSTRARRLTEGAILATYAAAQYLLTDPEGHSTRR